VSPREETKAAGDLETSSGIDVQGVRVLLVDDAVEIRIILEYLLKSRGAEVMLANNGQEALDQVEKEHFDLILMDIQLPVIDGYEAARRIKADPALRHIPIIAVTSYALSGDEAKALAAGCDGYLAKPFSPRVLLAKVRAFLA
jgi:two-component system cell cycle response regulator DivK